MAAERCGLFHLCQLTIGYGDLVPTRIITRAIALLIGLIGILLTGLVAALGVRALQATAER
jgi:hypothetical protein